MMWDTPLYLFALCVCVFFLLFFGGGGGGVVVVACSGPLQVQKVLSALNDQNHRYLNPQLTGKVKNVRR